MLRRGSRVGKYRIGRRLGKGGFAEVYRAIDTVEQVDVALKVPLPTFQSPSMLEDFRKEIRLTARLEHPCILGVKNAESYDGRLVVAYPLGKESLDERLQRRLSLDTRLAFGRQMLEALAYAHARRIIHCDVKPDNLILFDTNRLRLTDFGIAKVAALRTMSASGTGTVGYVAPEQALGRPSFRSDVFSAGLVLYRMLAGTLPSWPFEWPLPGSERLRRLPRGWSDFFRKALQVDDRKRFPDAEAMLASYRRLLAQTERQRRSARRRTRPAPANAKKSTQTSPVAEFLRHHRGAFHWSGNCRRCQGPVTAAMRTCPWCGSDAPRPRVKKSDFPAQCARCGRGRKLDWHYCGWCHGPGFARVANRQYTDVRYEGRCANPKCGRKHLMPFMRYCPWCRTKVKRKWKPEGSRDRCPRCKWGVFGAHWEHCPWCSRTLPKKAKRGR